MSIVKTICAALERIAPIRLAEKWDNVGLLLEAPLTRPQANRILLTIDLTPAVVTEALDTPTAFIVSYHPTIFHPLKSLTLSNPLQASILRCATAGISVYSPHTSLDSFVGGINDWLCLGLNDQAVPKSEHISYIGEDKEGLGGLGRIITFPHPVSMNELQRRVKAHLKLEHIQVGYTAARDLSTVRSVAVCAGSGGSVLLGVDADVYFTGEMAHHEVLAALGTGHNVLLCGHTNTERGFLPVLAEHLKRQLTNELPNFEIHVSKEDHHPLAIV
ncbi:NGG1p interacting factor 3 [Rhodofomes roseus]|uniref:NGG1p interacting factor 3 n=1 Tax=Rhodofomes roseus TaxID=34475 RepID=A0ABQ8KHZ3_9APHY|nr:NGG1p interacting factor 3 [Rhodofomes roseus]KAH9837286.1 NGG1p interacting factor 3 [Rhodofomes roseus]